MGGKGSDLVEDGAPVRTTTAIKGDPALAGLSLRSAEYKPAFSGTILTGGLVF